MRESRRRIRQSNFLIGVMAVLSVFMAGWAYMHSNQQDPGPIRVFEVLIHQSKTAIVLTDVRGLIQDINLAAEDLFGVRRANVIGKEVDIIVPANKQSVHREALDRGLDRTFPVGSVQTVECEIVRDGETIPIRVQLRYLNNFQIIALVDVLERE